MEAPEFSSIPLSVPWGFQVPNLTEMWTNANNSYSMSLCRIIITTKFNSYQIYLPRSVPPHLPHHPKTCRSFLLLLLFSTRTAANMWFHLSSSEIRVEKNRLMVISLSLSLLSLLTVAGLDERTCIFCFSFKFRCPKKLQMWAARHTYTKMLEWKKWKTKQCGHGEEQKDL